MGNWPSNSTRPPLERNGKPFIFEGDRVLVKWEGYSEEHICWVDERDVDKDARPYKDFAARYFEKFGMRKIQFEIVEGQVIFWPKDIEKLEKPKKKRTRRQPPSIVKNR